MKLHSISGHCNLGIAKVAAITENLAEIKIIIFK